MPESHSRIGPRISAFGDEIAAGLEEQIDVLTATGVPALELRAAWGVSVVDLTAEQLARAARLLSAAGIVVSAIGSPVGKAPVGGDFDVELARLRAAMRAARHLDTRRIRIFSFYIPGGRHSDFRDEVLRRMSRFAEEAAAEGLVLSHENESYIYGDDAEHCRDLVESVDSPALESAFDPANFVQVGVRPFDEAWPLLKERVGHFHVKDAVRVDRRGIAPYPAPVPDDRLGASVRPAGDGEGQLRELLGELAARGYDGYLVVEPHLGEHLSGLDPVARFKVALGALRAIRA